ncbi:serine dehydratase subunit alpha family protein [Alginatibacterium sediminis]|uniref:Serine dehydratase subunit alpha family protein n=1 Tax=Alginatibacterium sediminis TaxID=2164068 RepID=A0A420E9F4_9ALTE|nr:serine dehydratase subunit alpha family protein [Alginatibacterium sediminis]
MRPALGCTEPVTVALASAKCQQLLGELPSKIEVQVTPNLYKNAMGVMVPGTGDKGLVVACLAGLIAGDADAGLEVLKNFGTEHQEQLSVLRETIEIEIKLQEHTDVLFTQVRAYTDSQQACVVIERSHSNIVFAQVCQINQLIPGYVSSTVVLDAHHLQQQPMSVASIVDFALRVPLPSIAFIAQSEQLNLALASEGMKHEYGLGLGRQLQNQTEQGLLSDDLLNRAMRLSAAASDARMGGAPLAAMSNSGSGNQGIASSLPVVAALQILQADTPEQLRALCMSQLMAIYIKQQQPALSALCAANTAAIGSGAAITWLLGGDLSKIETCIQLMVADATGVFCDGANAGCALKVSTGAANAIKTALLAMSPGLDPQADMGISLSNADASIAQLGQFAHQAMQETDRQIIKLIRDCEYQGQKSS